MASIPGDRLALIMVICLTLAAVRVAMVMFYLTDKPPPTQGPVGQLQHYAEIEEHRVLLRKLEAQRQLKIERQAAEEDSPPAAAGAAQAGDKSDGGKPEDIKPDLSKGRWLHDEIKFRVTPTDGCPLKGQHMFLLSLILSYPKNWEQRQAIRNSWGGTEQAEHQDTRFIKTLFFVGSPPTEPLRSEMATKLKYENEEHGDIIQTSVFESVKKESPPMIRLLAAFKWVLVNCPQVDYVFIGNDELFVNYPNLVKSLSSRTDFLYMGRSKKNARPQRVKTEWDYVPEIQFKGEFYPTYCVAPAGFVLSTEFIRPAYSQALKNANRAKKFPLGDVYLGIISLELTEAKYRPRYNDNFRKLGGEANYCDLRDSVTIGEFNTAKRQAGAWGNYTTPVDKCPPDFPNATDIAEWSHEVDNKPYFEKVLTLRANPTDACKRNENTRAPPYLLALVSSQPEHFELRDAIRKTWGAPRYMGPLNARTLFILGRSKNQTEAMAQRIFNEAQSKGDIIIADFNESFHNLTLKVVLGLQWVSQHCKEIKFIYKGDDDMLVNFGRIIEHLEHLPGYQTEKYFLGHMMQRSPVIRTGSKYFVSRDTYPFKYFLPYFSGGGYIFSLAAATAMYESSVHTKLIPIDDAFAGILAFKSSIKLSGSNDFITTGSRKDACRLRTAFNLHGFRRTSIMIDTWNQFLDPDNTCDD